MKIKLIVLLLSLTQLTVYAGGETFYYSISNNVNWTAASGWSSTSGGGTCLCTPSITGAKEIIHIESNVFLVSNLTLGPQTTLTIYAGDTLEVTGNVVFSNGTIVNINAGGVFIVTGNVTNNNNSNNIHIDGELAIDGNFSGGVGSTVTGTGSVWTTGSIVTTGTGSVFGSTANCYSGICFGAALGALPIELASFEVIPKSTVVKVLWETLTETNNDYFTVERSKDGYFFEEVMQVNGAGTSNGVISYSHIDNYPYQELSYYRLKQIDFNGDYTYSNIVSVYFSKEEEATMTVFPNPWSQQGPAKISLEGFAKGDVRVVLQDIMGKEMFLKTVAVEENEQLYIINPSGVIPSGVYLITATSENAIYSSPLIIK